MNQLTSELISGAPLMRTDTPEVLLSGREIHLTHLAAKPSKLKPTRVFFDGSPQRIKILAKNKSQAASLLRDRELVWVDDTETIQVIEASRFQNTAHKAAKALVTLATHSVDGASEAPNGIIAIFNNEHALKFVAEAMAGLIEVEEFVDEIYPTGILHAFSINPNTAMSVVSSSLKV